MPTRSVQLTSWIIHWTNLRHFFLWPRQLSLYWGKRLIKRRKSPALWGCWKQCRLCSLCPQEGLIGANDLQLKERIKAHLLGRKLGKPSLWLKLSQRCRWRVGVVGSSWRIWGARSWDVHVFWIARWEVFLSCHGTWLRSLWSLLSPSPNSAMCIPRPHPRSVGGVVDVGETAHSSISSCVSDHINPI